MQSLTQWWCQQSSHPFGRDSKAGSKDVGELPGEKCKSLWRFLPREASGELTGSGTSYTISLESIFGFLWSTHDWKLKPNLRKLWVTAQGCQAICHRDCRVISWVCVCWGCGPDFSYLVWSRRHSLVHSISHCLLSTCNVKMTTLSLNLSHRKGRFVVIKNFEHKNYICCLSMVTYILCTSPTFSHVLLSQPWQETEIQV